jgi:uncharacterized protein YyaL (SSP411 family)
LPNNYLFLLRWAVLADQKHVLDHVHLTLKKMAYGGIYDQIGGGFARYSTDVWWKVPHFEKMLYDNGQLMSLYAEAYQQNADADYKDVCLRTAAYIQREMTAPEGYFYSALDADSEGVEGKFYTWTIDELKSLLTEEEFRVTSVYYNLNTFGYWEHEQYILLRRDENPIVAEVLEIEETQLQQLVQQIDAKLMQARAKRIRPGLDDKLLCSWNAMMIRGLADAARVLEDATLYEQAVTACRFLLSELKEDNGRLMHAWKNGKANVTGFLEDYAFLMDALIGLYEYSYEEAWLIEARDLMFTALGDFERSETGLFYFTSSQQNLWVARQMETSDNVQPASNSMMARTLYTLGIYFGKADWMQQSDTMMRTIREELLNYGPGYSNWGMLALMQVLDFKELVISGPNAKREATTLRKQYRPDVLIAAAESPSELPLMEGRIATEKLTYYLCRGTVCEAPLYDIADLHFD